MQPQAQPMKQNRTELETYTITDEIMIAVIIFLFCLTGGVSVVIQM